MSEWQDGLNLALLREKLTDCERALSKSEAALAESRGFTAGVATEVDRSETDVTELRHELSALCDQCDRLKAAYDGTHQGRIALEFDGLVSYLLHARNLLAAEPKAKS